MCAFSVTQALRSDSDTDLVTTRKSKCMDAASAVYAITTSFEEAIAGFLNLVNSSIVTEFHYE